MSSGRDSRSNRDFTTDRACDNCRERKTKCSSLRSYQATAEPCGPCLKSGLECTYKAAPKKRGPGPGKRLRALKERAHSGNETPSSSSASVEPSTSFQPGPSQPSPSFYSKEELRNKLELFYTYGYALLPVLDIEKYLFLLEANEQLHNVDLRCCLIAIASSLEAGMLRVDPSRGGAELTRMVDMICHLRTLYRFADAPTIETASTSVLMFCACNILGRQKAAFHYLTEAIGMLGQLEDLRDDRERIIRKRLEYVLFVAEKVSISIYSPSKHRFCPVPVNIPTSPDALLLPRWPGVGVHQLDWEQRDREAAELLLLMIRLHVATDVNEIISLGLSAPARYGITEITHVDRIASPPIYETQCVDVAVTRQWLLAQWLASVLKGYQTSAVTSMTMFNVGRAMGTFILSRVSSLNAGFLRIVGLGKLADIARTLYELCGQLGDPPDFRNLLVDLIICIGINDYEKYYVSQLSDCIAKLYINLPVPRPHPVIPPSVGSPPRIIEYSAEYSPITRDADDPNSDLALMWPHANAFDVAPWLSAAALSFDDAFIAINLPEDGVALGELFGEPSTYPLAPLP